MKRRELERPKTDRLASLQHELANLDAEIEDLYQDLDDSGYSDELKSDNDLLISKSISKGPPKYVGTSDRNRLYRDSVAVLEKRTHKIENTLTDQECSDLLLPKRNIRIPGYKPPSERITESTTRKEQFIKDKRAEQEQKFKEEYTFKPVTNSRKVSNYDAGHLWERSTSGKFVPKRETKEKHMNTNSKRIAERLEEDGKDFMSRQFRRKPQKRAQSVQKIYRARKMTPNQINDSTVRLSKPKPIFEGRYLSDDDEPKQTKRSDPRTFERLVSESLKKKEPEIEKIETFSFMNKRSRQMTRNITEDLYEQSLAHQEKRRQRIEEVKQWQELADITRASCQPVIRHQAVKVPKKCTIAGMNDFLERMKKKQTKEPEAELSIQKYSNRPIIARPFSFEQRVQKSQHVVDREVDDVLAEINALLRE